MRANIEKLNFEAEMSKLNSRGRSFQADIDALTL